MNRKDALATISTNLLFISLLKRRRAPKWALWTLGLLTVPSVIVAVLPNSLKDDAVEHEHWN